jgi:hypothetical protein
MPILDEKQQTLNQFLTAEYAINPQMTAEQLSALSAFWWLKNEAPVPLETVIQIVKRFATQKGINIHDSRQ